MIDIQIRVYAELNDFLPPGRRQRAFERRISSRTSLKDLLEGVGVPHPEIGAVLVNGEPRTFDFLMEAESRVAAYPWFRSILTTGLPDLRPALVAPPRFLLDVHLGRLARYLRLLGFDVRYDNAADDDQLIARLRGSDRILLTRDRELLMRRSVVWGYYLREVDPQRQLAEVVRRFDLAAHAEPFTRCLSCNGKLVEVEKADIQDRLEPGTRRHFDRFWQCRECGNLYWEGSHFQRLAQLVDITL